jgi:hypothetical protein
MGIAMMRGPRVLAALAALALLTALLGGCASAQNKAPAATHAPSAWNAPPTATPSPPPPPTRSFQQVWGAAPITRLATGVANNQEVFDFLNAATPDGQWLIGEVVPRAFVGSTSIIPYLAAYNVHTRQIMRVHALSAPQRGISLVATDGTWIVWQELYSGQMGATDGVIRILNWKTGDYREYPQAMMISLAVENGKAIWSQITPNEPNAAAADQTAIVRLADLNAGTVTTLAQHATGAALAWPWAGWGVATDTSGGGYLQFKNLTTGQTSQTAPVIGQTIQALADSLTLHGVSAVFTMYYGSEVDEIPDVSRADIPQTIFDNVKPGLGGASTNGRLIAWGMSAGGPIPQVFDSAERALVTLPTTSAQSYVAWTGANLLVWDDPAPAAQQQADEAAGLAPLSTLCVVDTSALPTTPPA